MNVDYDIVVAMLDGTYNGYAELGATEKAQAIKTFKQEFVAKFGTITAESVSYEGDQMMSLYEYLGRAAGGQLGKEVASAAVANKVPIGEQHVELKSYVGPVKTYPRTFLQEYFG